MGAEIVGDVLYVKERPPDPEIEALRIIVAAFEELDVAALIRTLAYLDDRYGAPGLLIDGRPQEE